MTRITAALFLTTALASPALAVEPAAVVTNYANLAEATEAARDAGRNYITIASEYLGQDA